MEDGREATWASFLGMTRSVLIFFVRASTSSTRSYKNVHTHAVFYRRNQPRWACYECAHHALVDVLASLDSCADQPVCKKA
jgi:hypothetical protein